MIIPISMILPWLIIMVGSFVAGVISHVLTCYPGELNIKEWLMWTIAWFVVLVVMHATHMKWIIWA